MQGANTVRRMHRILDTFFRPLLKGSSAVHRLMADSPARTYKKHGEYVAREGLDTALQSCNINASLTDVRFWDNRRIARQLRPASASQPILLRAREPCRYPALLWLSQKWTSVAAGATTG